MGWFAFPLIRLALIRRKALLSSLNTEQTWSHLGALHPWRREHLLLTGPAHLPELISEPHDGANGFNKTNAQSPPSRIVRDADDGPFKRWRKTIRFHRQMFPGSATGSVLRYIFGILPELIVGICHPSRNKGLVE